MGLKVLLADDETEYVDTLAERLELRDYSVRVVHDGISALTAVEEDMPDVVVLDLFMPGLPGNKVLAELNRRYVETYGEALGIEYRERDGGHTWGFWQNNIADVFKWLDINGDKNT